MTYLRLLRQRKGISLREAARLIGVSPAFLSGIETGRIPLPKTENTKYEEFYGTEFPRTAQYMQGYEDGLRAAKMGEVKE